MLENGLDLCREAGGAGRGGLDHLPAAADQVRVALLVRGAGVAVVGFPAVVDQCAVKIFADEMVRRIAAAGLARGRGLKVGVGHHYRLLPSLVETRRRIAEGAIGAVTLVTAVVAQPWLAAKRGAEDSWRFDPKITAGGVLSDPGGHLIDALLWTTGQTAVEVAAVQSRIEAGPDLVTAAALRLADGTPVTLGVTGVAGNRARAFNGRRRFRRRRIWC